MEVQLKLMGAEIARQKRKPTLTHVVLARNPTTHPYEAEKEQEELYRLSAAVAQVVTATVYLFA